MGMFSLRSLAALPLVVAALLSSAAAQAAAPKVLPPTVAVLYLDYAGQDEALASLRKGLTQMLISDLSQSDKLTLVERVQLEAVMDELKLGQTRAIDGTTAAKVGKLLGARYLVLGGYFEFAGSLRVDVRVVHVETGKLVRGFGVTGKGDDFLAIHQQLVAGLLPILTSVAAEVSPPQRVAKPEDKSPEPGIQKRPQAPPRLRTKTAARYGKALDLMDKGKKTEARDELQQVLAEEPGFGLADHDLQRLVQ